jgi:hypothetical protein
MSRRGVVASTRSPVVAAESAAQHPGEWRSFTHGRTWLGSRFVRRPCMSFQPSIDPLRLQADRAPAADTRVTELAALTRRVDCVATDTCMVSRLGDGQPSLHDTHPARPPCTAGAKPFGALRHARAPPGQAARIGDCRCLSVSRGIDALCALMADRIDVERGCCRPGPWAASRRRAPLRCSSGGWCRWHRTAMFERRQASRRCQCLGARICAIDPSGAIGRRSSNMAPGSTACKTRCFALALASAFGGLDAVSARRRPGSYRRPD